MTSNEITKGILKTVAILAGVLLFLFFLYKIQSVLIYLSIAAVISLIARPIVRFLKRKLKFPNTLAVITTMLFFIILFLGIISLFIPLVIQQSKNLSLLDINKLSENIQYLFSEINAYFSSHNINIFEEFKEFDLFKNFKAIPNLLNDIFGALGTFSIGLFSVIFITFFLMKDSNLLENSIYVLSPDKNKNKLQTSIDTIKGLLSRYFVGLILQITVLLVIYTVILLIFGIENALVIAFLCALLNLIPYVGPLISGILMAFLTMSSYIGQDFQTEIIPKTLYVMGGFLFAQLIDNFVSQPLIFSNSVKSHPLEIFLIIIIGGILFGVTGMIIAVPAYTAIKVILKTFLSDNKIVKSLTKNL